MEVVNRIINESDVVLTEKEQLGLKQLSKFNDFSELDTYSKIELISQLFNTNILTAIQIMIKYLNFKNSLFEECLYMEHNYEVALSVAELYLEDLEDDELIISYNSYTKKYIVTSDYCYDMDDNPIKLGYKFIQKVKKQ